MLVANASASTYFRGGRFRLLLAISSVESIDASRGIDQFLLTRKERVASRTDFDVQIALAGRARLEGLAARASYCDFVIFRMNSRFHFYFTLYSCQFLVSAK